MFKTGIASNLIRLAILLLIGPILIELVLCEIGRLAVGYYTVSQR
jgi:hypothetical protein